MSALERASNNPNRFSHAASMVVKAAFELGVANPNDNFAEEVAWHTLIFTHVAGKPVWKRRKVAQTIHNILRRSSANPAYTAFVTDHVHTEVLRTLEVPSEYTPTF